MCFSKVRKLGFSFAVSDCMILEVSLCNTVLLRCPRHPAHGWRCSWPAVPFVKNWVSSSPSSLNLRNHTIQSKWPYYGYLSNISGPWWDLARNFIVILYFSFQNWKLLQPQTPKKTQQTAVQCFLLKWVVFFGCIGPYMSLYTGSMPTQMPAHAYVEWKGCLWSFPGSGAYARPSATFFVGWSCTW